MEYKNKDGIVISDDEFIGETFKNVTINTPVFFTERMMQLNKKVQDLALHIYYSISIEISNYYSQPEMPVNGDQQKLNEIIEIFKSITNILLRAELLTYEEVEADLKDINHCYSDDFITRCQLYAFNFLEKFENFNSQFAHA